MADDAAYSPLAGELNKLETYHELKQKRHDTISPLAGELNKLETQNLLVELLALRGSPLAGELNKLETSPVFSGNFLAFAPHSLGNSINWKPDTVVPILVAILGFSPLAGELNKLETSNPRTSG